MRTVSVLALILLLGTQACNLDCPNCNPSVGPMTSQIQTLEWTHTQTPNQLITPQTAGYYQKVLRMSKHIYVLKDEVIVDRLRRLKDDEDWKNHRVTLNYENGYKQTFQFVYDGNDNRRGLREVVLSAMFQGEYNAASDTVKAHYKNVGTIEQKYMEDEEEILNKLPSQ